MDEANAEAEALQDTLTQLAQDEVQAHFMKEQQSYDRIMRWVMGD
jgi:hypothetical protein